MALRFSPRRVTMTARFLFAGALRAGPRAVVAAGGSVSRAAYPATIFTAAFLLFAVEPLMGKFMLPWFGGAQSVWTTCILFFQLLLLAGYAYAHLIATRLRPRRQAALHLALVAVCVVAMATLAII